MFDRMRRPAARIWTVAAVAVGVGLVPVHALTANAAAGGTPSCAAPSAGGDWRSYGHDDANSRSQPDEKSLNSSAAATLSPVWSLAVAPSPSTLGGVPSAGLNGTPVVADGCVFAGGSDGHIVALNADTGAQVWRTSQLGDPNAAGTGGLIVGSVTVVGGKVIALINQSGGPFAVALDERTGQQVWQSQPVSHYPGSYTNANPVVYTGTLIFGFSAPEGDPKGQGGFALLSTASGHIDIVTDTIPPADQDRGYAGGGIWTAPAVDPQSGYAYLGAGNPSSKQMEHRNTNAILKVDLNPGASYGQIVAAYKGNVDQYEASQLTQTPVCAASEGTALDEFPLDDPACGQLDLDFGAAPNLFQDGQGHELIGELQKSGYYHAAYTDTMERAWTAPIGGPCAFCNADSSAVVGNSIYAVGTPGGVLASMGTATGQLNWASPVADGVHYGSVSTADGVVYTLDSLGFLDAADAATGAPLLHRPVFADTKQPATNITSAGVAIARHTVYVEAGGSLVAYQPKGLALP